MSHSLGPRSGFFPLNPPRHGTFKFFFFFSRLKLVFFSSFTIHTDHEFSLVWGASIENWKKGKKKTEQVHGGKLGGLIRRAMVWGRFMTHETAHNWIIKNDFPVQGDKRSLYFQKTLTRTRARLAVGKNAIPQCTLASLQSYWATATGLETESWWESHLGDCPRCHDLFIYENEKIGNSDIKSSV